MCVCERARYASDPRKVFTALKTRQLNSNENAAFLFVAASKYLLNYNASVCLKPARLVFAAQHYYI